MERESDHLYRVAINSSARREHIGSVFEFVNTRAPSRFPALQGFQQVTLPSFVGDGPFETVAQRRAHGAWMPAPEVLQGQRKKGLK